MGADNWGICPKCKKIADTAKAKQLKKVQDAYGKVAVEKFLEMRKESELPIKYEQTLREDYYVGLDEEGKFEVQYSGSCKVCSLQFKYNYSEEVKGV